MLTDRPAPDVASGLLFTLLKDAWHQFWTDYRSPESIRLVSTQGALSR